MLPTQLLGFNWLGFFVILLITLVIFAATIYITSSSVLRKNTVDLMKNDSQDSPKLASRGMKRVFGRFGILTKFRVAVAFNSI
jgi:putative ABC transport system permease protein